MFAPFCVADLRAFLLGPWRLDRRIFDRRMGVTGAFSGTVRFDADGAGLRATETGRMTYGGSETDADRVLLYRFKASSRARVLYPDGQFFHDLDLAAGRARVRHLCGQDDYVGGFWVPRDGIMIVRWRVRGPRKDLVLLGHMERFDKV